MTSTEFATWLRRQREERGWTRAEMARQLIQAGRAWGDRHVPGLDGMTHNVYRWERGGTMSERYKLHYCRAFDIKLAQFEAAAGTVAGEPAIRTRAPHMGEFTVEREVLMAAHEGSEHAERADGPGLGDVTVEQLRADLIRLSHASDTGEPLPVFLDMRRVRSRIYRLLDQRLWPREQSDLYFLLGCLNGLMGIAANRLGYPDAAEELIRAGWAYANGIDHRPLMAQLRQQLAYVAYWRGGARECRDLAASGLEYLSAGPVGADLHLKYARAAAVLGDADGARQAIAKAHEAREHEYHDELTEIGGELVVSLATHHSGAGLALTGIPGAEDEAAAEVERAVGLYDAGPRPGEQHWFGGKALASVDLATLRLRAGALDAAVVALQPVLSLSEGRRIASVISRLALVRSELAQPIYQRSAQARELNERIEEFGRESITVGLHSLPGAPG